MSVQIHINGDNAAEAVKELSSLAAHLNITSGAPAASTSADLPAAETKPKTSRNKPKDEPVAPPEQEKAPAETTDDPVEEDDDPFAEPAGKVPTVVELRAKAQEVGTTPEAKKSIKALLDKYGSKSISDVPEDLRAEFLAKLEALA